MSSFKFQKLKIKDPISNIICLSIYLRGAYDKFPDIFVWAFKIVEVSWKFSMLLQYILWDGQFLVFQVQMNTYCRNSNTPY